MPALVRVEAYSTGTIMVASSFSIDWDTYTATTTSVATPYLIPVSAYASDTGFVISPDGYILTNAHVMSQQSIIDAALTNFEQALVNSSYKALSKAAQKTAASNASTTQGAAQFSALETSILQGLHTYSSSSIATTVTVLDPSTSAGDVPDAIAVGFPAKVVNADDDYVNDQKDIAIIKIDQNGLPALPVANVDPADPSVGSLSTFAVSADGNSFELVPSGQDGAGGSTGSPLLDNKGEAVGILTGSSVVPASVISAFLQGASVYPVAGNLYTYFMNGLSLEAASHCAEAVSDFDEAKSGNTHFPVDSFVSSYIQDCQALQASGKSIDSDMDQFKVNLLSIKTPLIIVVGAIILLIILLIVVSVARRISRKRKAAAPQQSFALRMAEQMAKSVPEYKTSMNDTMSVPAAFTGVNVMPRSASEMYAQPKVTIKPSTAVPIFTSPAPVPSPVLAPTPLTPSSVTPRTSAPAPSVSPSPRLVETPVYAPRTINPTLAPKASATPSAPETSPLSAPSSRGPSVPGMSGPIDEGSPKSFADVKTFTAGPRFTPAPISFSTPAARPNVASSIVAAAPVSKEKVDAAIAYLENQQKIGTSEGAMLAALRSMGYGEKEIEQAFMNVEREGR